MKQLALFCSKLNVGLMGVTARIQKIVIEYNLSLQISVKKAAK